MPGVLSRMALYLKQKNLFPGTRKLIQKHFDLNELRTESWSAKDPYDETQQASDYPSRYPFTLGIVKEFWHNHRHYISACRELGVAYKVLDLGRPDWQEIVRASGCDPLLVVPSVNFSSWKQMYDERVRILIEVMGCRVFPCYEGLWMWESKRRMHYWLQGKGIDHPKSWVFYDRQEALRFAAQAPLPIVYKSNMGSGASGVIIFRDRGALKKHINLCFRKGYTNARRGPSDKEFGSVFLQEYLCEVREWRIVRIGESYFGFEKLQAGDFHSGSHQRCYGQPPDRLLDFAKEVFDAGPFSSMSLDIFVTGDGRYLVNELQTYFGIQDNHEMCVVDGRPGRMLHDPAAGSWSFQEGSFCQNYLYNQRVLCLLQSLGCAKPPPC